VHRVRILQAISTCGLVHTMQEAEQANERIHKSELEERRAAHSRLKGKNEDLQRQVLLLQREAQAKTAARQSDDLISPEVVGILKGQVC
jgi:hypothetical protein